MIQNESEIDRIIRVVVGTILIMIGISVMDGLWQVIVYVFGGVMIITGFTGFCLIYKLFGISTK